MANNPKINLCGCGFLCTNNWVYGEPLPQAGVYREFFQLAGPLIACCKQPCGNNALRSMPPEVYESIRAAKQTYSFARFVVK